MATGDDDYVVDKPIYRAAANTGEGWKNANLRTQFLKIIGLAKVSSWARLFHSMRASRQTELEREFPLHVVCAWLGNSPKIAQRSYLLVTSADFEKAISTPQKSGTKSGTIRVKSGTISGTASVRTESQEIANHQGKQRRNVVFPGESQKSSADGEGFEYHSNSQGKVDFPEDVARNPARSQMESLLIELWASATDAAKLQAIEVLRNNPTQTASRPTHNGL